MAKFETNIGAGDIYKSYKKDSKNAVSRALFSKITREFNESIMNFIVLESFEFHMPYRLGRLRVRKYKPKVRFDENGNVEMKYYRTDWKASKELWKKTYPGKTPEELKQIKNKPIVRHLNRHTDGYQHKFIWHKKENNIRNNSAYAFIPSRHNKRFLARVLLDPSLAHKIDFFE